MKKLLFVVIFAIIALGVWGQEGEVYYADGFSIEKYEDQDGNNKLIVEVYTQQHELNLIMCGSDNFCVSETGAYHIFILENYGFNSKGEDLFLISLIHSEYNPETKSNYKSIWCGEVALAGSSFEWLEE